MSKALFVADCDPFLAQQFAARLLHSVISTVVGEVMACVL